ncbi:MAG: DUF452 family protein [Rikenellaceae bacterium]
MQVDFLRNNHSENLIIFALGWGTDSSVISHLISQIPDCYDVMCTYDYKSIEKIDHLCNAYSRVYLLAWSFGVWASEKMFENKKLITKAVAFCASPLPVNDEFGIAPKRLRITIKGFKSQGAATFDKSVYQDQIMFNTKREIGEKIEELEILASSASLSYTPEIEWDRAIIGERDTIFPAKNLLAYWGIRAKVLPLPHYPFKDYKLIAHALGI